MATLEESLLKLAQTTKDLEKSYKRYCKAHDENMAILREIAAVQEQTLTTLCKISDIV